MFQLGRSGQAVKGDETPVSLHGGEGVFYFTIDNGVTRIEYVNEDVPRVLDATELFGQNVA